jgi:isoaspartyl peptidase/L-asparaginase-like protein (Ntn-hydrolase superfamily)
MSLITYREAIKQALAEEIERDENVCIMGEVNKRNKEKTTINQRKEEYTNSTNKKINDRKKKTKQKSNIKQEKKTRTQKNKKNHKKP